MLKLLAPFALLALATAAGAQDGNPSAPIVVSRPWLRATPKGAPVVGGYATLTNAGTEPDRLVGASLEGTARGEIHTMSTRDGVMHMERLADGLSLAPGATVTLAPGGFHLMFLQPSAQFKEGETVHGALAFARAGSIPVTFPVAGIAATAAPGAPPDAPTGVKPEASATGVDGKR